MKPAKQATLALRPIFSLVCPWRRPALGALLMIAGACGGSSDEGGSSSSNAKGTILLAPSRNTSPTAESTASATSVTPGPSLQGFTKTELGGYKLGAEIKDGQGLTDTGLAQPAADQNCNTLVGVVRDFKGSSDSDHHPDFQAYNGDTPTHGLVKDLLGSADRKPVYAGECDASKQDGDCTFGQQMSTKADFDQWYRFTEGVNKPYVVYFSLVPNDKVFTFRSNFFSLWMEPAGKIQPKG